MRPAATLIVRLSIGSVAHAEKLTGAVFREDGEPATGAAETHADGWSNDKEDRPLAWTVCDDCRGWSTRLPGLYGRSGLLRTPSSSSPSRARAF